MDIDQLLGYLRNGNTRAFNRNRPRPTPDGVLINLSGIIIPRGTTLAGVNLSHTNLSGARFIGANLTKADLTCADLSDARFCECTLDGALFGNAALRRTAFCNMAKLGAHFWGADFTEADLTGVDPDEIMRIRKEGVRADTVRVAGQGATGHRHHPKLVLT